MIVRAGAAPVALTLMKSGLDLVIERCLMNSRDLCRRRPAPAVFDHGVDLCGGAGKDRLDRAVTIVAHPSVQAETACGAQGPAPKPDTLHSPQNSDTHTFSVVGHGLAHAIRDIPVFNLLQG